MYPGQLALSKNEPKAANPGYIFIIGYKIVPKAASREYKKVRKGYQPLITKMYPGQQAPSTIADPGLLAPGTKMYQRLKARYTGHRMDIFVCIAALSTANLVFSTLYLRSESGFLKWCILSSLRRRHKQLKLLDWKFNFLAFVISYHNFGFIPNFEMSR